MGGKSRTCLSRRGRGRENVLTAEVFSLWVTCRGPRSLVRSCGQRTEPHGRGNVQPRRLSKLRSPCFPTNHECPELISWLRPMPRW